MCVPFVEMYNKRLIFEIKYLAWRTMFIVLSKKSDPDPYLHLLFNEWP